ncbi:VRR-NUC domain-containing protein [Halomonas sp.]|uniref:VRR-NUC domain-containing protein n=1 Tax=Halomonas sp. TaxID=1486246 RepID=UPI003D1395C4
MAGYRTKRRSLADIKRNPPPGAKGRQAPRRKPVDREGQEQAVLMRWLLGEKMRRTPVGALYDMTYHVPNGGARHAKTASDLKKQGVRSGVSDLVVMDARGGWFGLYLEFKATPPHHAALQGSQREWLEMAEALGYCAVLARGLEEAKDVLRAYAAWPETEIQGSVMMMEAGTEWQKEGETDGGTGEADGGGGDDA